ncbi:hypothetical protein PLEOSDRAFT_1090687 [Pleurotus ostreatus PC15]|uniref:Zn(2)-C6 fungal-type domain-containing protein n=1 Tax=Pleurotus ostreatus (strain PC15) TaxID=1137138 RepID=A0A067NJ68_PLEO1|nr:hypothetical protein PLEOSDRAFT_1090687 [Pleurotus ostreatus PC15]
MAGDHQCSVCQATFTRPQHAARHMRSHTGDKPYKCPFCADQFARSDLLSRHVNKAHASEKPSSGSATQKKAASRATTSKQSCDQCVQSNSPCNGSYPCSQCTQSTIRCTFVKFHRQTAPIGPGHNPTDPHLSSSTLAASSAPSDPLDPAALPTPPMFRDPTSASMYTSPFLPSTAYLPDDTPHPDLPKPSGADFAKYKSQAEYIRRLPLFQPTVDAPPPTSTATPGWGDEPSATTAADPSISAEVDYAGNARRLSMEFSSDSSASPSPTWSSVRLPPDISAHQHPYPYHATHAHTHSNDLQDEDALAGFSLNAEFAHDDGGCGFASALGLMSLEDPDALPGCYGSDADSDAVASFFAMYAMDAFPDNPGWTPMPRKPAPSGASRLARPHLATPDAHSPGARDEDEALRVIRDSWAMYLRTPPHEPIAPSAPDEPDECVCALVCASTDFASAAPGSTPQPYHRARVSSLPRAVHGDADDLGAYAAAVCARRAPLRLSLGPRSARGATIASSGRKVGAGPGAGDGGGSGSSGSGSGAESVRPAFKRLASRTLGPEHAKRQTPNARVRQTTWLNVDAQKQKQHAFPGFLRPRCLHWRRLVVSLADGA